MSNLQPVASLWVQEELGWLHKLALASFVARGHQTTLYHVCDAAPAVPEGVTCLPAGQVWDYDPTLLETLPPASFADIFRLHMVQRTGQIWVDTDMLCLKPFEPRDGWLLGHESAHMINNAVIAMPPGAEAIAALLERIDDPGYIPEWVPPKVRAKARDAKDGNQLATVCSNFPTALGPRALSWALRKTGEDRHVLPREAFYAIPWGLVDILFNPHGGVEPWFNKNTLGVHLYASRIRQLHWRTRPFENSFIDRFAREIGFQMDMEMRQQTI